MRIALVLSAATIASIAGSAMAQQEELSKAPDQTLIFGSNVWTVGQTGTRATNAYNCVNAASTSFDRNFATNPPAGTWIMGDDCQLLNLSGGSIVDEVTFSAVNGTSTSSLGGGTAINVAASAIQADIYFWDLLGTDFNPTAPNFETKALLGGFTVNLPALNSLTFGNLTVTGLSGLNINVGSGNVWMGVVFHDNASIAGDQTAAAQRYGQIIANQVPTVGASANFIFKDKINGVADAAGFTYNSPITQSNLNYRIATIPTPGSFALLGLGGLVVARRRRA